MASHGDKFGNDMDSESGSEAGSPQMEPVNDVEENDNVPEIQLKPSLKKAAEKKEAAPVVVRPTLPEQRSEERRVGKECPV